MPFCVHCTRETVKRCECCPSTHYCSKKCQQADWSAVHRYERYFYRLDASDIVEGNATAGQRPRTKEEQLVDKVIRQEINDDRLEYARLLENTRTAIRARKPTKRVMRMTHKQRASLHETLDSMFTDPVVTRNEQRHEFITQLIQLVEKAGDVPTSLENPSVTRKIALDERAQAELAVLFRKQDIVYAKDAYAFVTGTITDAQDAALYRNYVEDIQARFTHALLFGRGDQALISYEAVRARVQEKSREALASGLADHVLKQATDKTAELWVKAHAEAERREKEEKRTRGYYSGGPKKGDDGGDGGEKGGIGLGTINAAVRKAMAAAFAMFGAMRDNGSISPEEADNNEWTLRETWDKITAPLSQCYAGIHGKCKIVDNILETVSNTYGINRKLGPRLGNFSLWPTLLVLVLYYFIALLFGYNFYTSPHSPEVAEALNQTDTIVKIQNETIALTEKQINDTVAAEVVVDRVRKLIGNPNATAGFMSVNWADPSIATMEVQLQVNASIAGLCEHILKTAPPTPVDDPMGYELAGTFYKYIDAIRDSKTIEDYAQNLRNLQVGVGTNANMLQATGSVITVDKAREILQSYSDFVNSTGATTKSILDGLRSEAAETRGVRQKLLDQRGRVLKEALDAQFTQGLLLRFRNYFGSISTVFILSAISFIAPYVLRPLLYGALDARGRDGISEISAAEKVMRETVLTSGMLEPDARLWSQEQGLSGTGRWLLALMYLLNPVKGVFYMFHIIMAGAMIMPLIRMPAPFLASFIELPGRWLANFMGQCWHGDVDDEDYNAMREVAFGEKRGDGGLMGVYMANGDSEAAKKYAFDMYLNGEDGVNTPQRYAILIELIMKKEAEINGGHVLMHEIALSMDALDAAFNVWSLYYLYSQIYSWAVKLVQMIYWIFCFVCAAPLLNGGIAFVGYLIIALLFSYVPHKTRRLLGTIPDRYFKITDVEVLKPAWCFLEFITKPTPLNIMIVHIVHWMLTKSRFFDPYVPLDGWIAPPTPYRESLVDHAIPQAERERIALDELKKLQDDQNLAAMKKRLDELGMKGDIQSLLDFLISKTKGNITQNDIDEMLKLWNNGTG